MKCPKCGYTSFDYLDSCKKCHHALGEFKAKYGLRSLLFPNRPQQSAPSAALSAAPPLAVAAATSAPAAAAVADSAASTDFGYDFLADTPAGATPNTEPAPAASADSFDFDADWNEAPATAPPPPATPIAGPTALAVDRFDFDADWDAPAASESRAPTGAGLEERGDDAFDFLTDAPDSATGPEAGADDLQLDLGDFSAPLTVAVEEPDFDFNDSWDGATAEDLPAAAASPAQEPLPEFAAEPLVFGDEFDFADEDQLGPLTPEPKASVASAKPGPKEGPSDPFDRREPALGPAPADSSDANQEFAAPSPDPALPPHAAADQPLDPPGPAEASAPPAAANAGEAAVLAAAEEDEPLLFALAEEDPAEAPAGELRPAGTPFLRLGAGALDLLLLGLIYALFLAAGKLALFPADQAMAPLPPEALLDLAIPYFLILFALCFGYFTLFHFLSGQTPGKMVFHLKVESCAGQPLDFAQAFLRSVGGLISLLCAGIGFLLILRGPDHQGWNDRLAGTRVAATGLNLNA
jgi:uncharacterized RDD family membrane protein YckC